MKLPAELRPEDVVAIQDTREQCAVCLSPLTTVIGTLATGDYSVRGLEHVVAIERKSADDMLCCIGRERGRFDREIQRLLAYPTRGIVIESTWTAFEAGNWRSWITCGVPIVMAGDHDRAGRYIARILFTAARRRWREARALVAAVQQEAAESAEAAA